MDVVARLIELKPGSAKRVQEWAEFVNQNKLDAEATLSAEEVSIESWFSLWLDGKDYLLCYMRSESIEQAEQIASRSRGPVDVYHQQFKVDTWVRGAGAEATLLVDLLGSHQSPF